ncbi:hypothetical protein [Okeania sp. SIO1H2]|uniref:hypothetical protein n=1 Tax=Okeania sp. SIO1H2 TaxID=2607775 RepID=UPI0013BE0CA9|nr:hypothetical protein [Okeania sp. SIO1H2]NET19290.1 hypothetical protein [Okeania sp. SIO1H5]NET92885.1 hypothetical protein [Okeania sp. SIO1H2]
MNECKCGHLARFGVYLTFGGICCISARSLDPSQKHLAFYICEKVIYQDGIESGEIEFINQLDQLDRTAFS